MNTSIFTAFSRHRGGSNLTMWVSALALGAVGLAAATPALAQYKQEIRNDMRRCSAGEGPAVMVTVDGVKSASGKMRVQAYRATSADWLQKGRWLSRIEVPARAGTMTFCVPVPAVGRYAIAVRHDANGNGDTDIRTDGGAMSNNPSINIFNLGKPSVTKTGFDVGRNVRSIRVQMRYM
jgi:uncharacterized protein (DUF2141 family)